MSSDQQPFKIPCGQCLYEGIKRSGTKQNMDWPTCQSITIPEDEVNNLSSILNPTEHLTSQPLHETEELKLFCETCQLLTCRNRTSDLHKDHRIAGMDKIAKVHRDAMKETLCTLTTRWRSATH